jgi:hypothetical protein
MIVLSRSVARSFRTLMRRSVIAAAPRGPAPPVLASADAEGLTLRATGTEVGLTLRLPPREGCEGHLAFPGELLGEFEGSGDTDVVLELEASKGRARWEDHGGPKVATFVLVDSEKIPALPPATRRLARMPPTFLRTLDDACRSAGREAGRLGLDRIQLRGKTGQIVATDGRQLLLQGGIRLPFGADLLIPALPVFGSRELAGAEPVCLGRSEGRLLVRAGPWCFDIQIDRLARFPAVDKVIPSSPQPTCLVLSEDDAQFLLEAIPGLPAEDEDVSSVTVDLDGQGMIRSRTETNTTEIVLASSQVTGPPLRVCIGRHYFMRTLKLGFRALELCAPDKPLVAREGHRLLVLATLDPKVAVGPAPDMVRLVTSGKSTAPACPPNERTPIMATSLNNGANGQHSEQSESFDPLVEAEALKAALQESLNRASRLIAGLRQFRKQHKAVASAMASLRQFQLTP